jgi:hypothetical protein
VNENRKTSKWTRKDFLVDVVHQRPYFCLNFAQNKPAELFDPRKFRFHLNNWASQPKDRLAFGYRTKVNHKSPEERDGVHT